MKNIILILILTVISCSKVLKTSQGNFVFNETLDFSIDYINNIEEYVVSSDTVSTRSYAVFKDSTSSGYGGSYFGSSDSNNQIIRLFDDLYFEYNSDGTIDNEYHVNPNKSIDKLHYYYRNDKLIKVDYIKISSIDTLVNVRKLYYDEHNNLYFEEINNPISEIQIEKKYNNSQLVYASILSYNHLAERTDETKINYFYENKLLTKLSVFNRLTNRTIVRDYFYNSHGKIISSQDTTFREDNLKPLTHHEYNVKKYQYDDDGRLSKVIKTGTNYKFIEEIQYSDNYHNEKIKPRYFDNMGYYANLRFSWY